jgi:steroid 5-alpha reductase family enzyme
LGAAIDDNKGSDMGLIDLLAINVAIVAACFIGLWLIGIALKDVTFVDSWWALGMVVLALAGFLRTGPPTPHKLALTVICAVWGLRLGIHLLARWRRDGPDRRYKTMLGKAETERHWNFATSSLLLVFALQAPLQFIVALPVQLGQAAPTAAPLGPIALVGVALGVIGIGFEAIGDWQLMRFKADPANTSTVMDRGLWRYTRHPNYFGDACVWVGLFLIAAETRFGLWSLPGPLLIVFLLTRWSGVPTVEGRLRRRRPGYEAYVQRTSGFVPWFPKRAV